MGNTSEDQVEELNKKHFVAQEGGKTRVYNETRDLTLQRNVITCSTFEDFKNKYLNKDVVIEVPKAKGTETKVIPLGQYWLRSPERRQYETIIFSPGKKEPEDVYNLWRGFAVEASGEGSCDLWKKHLQDNVCSGNQEYCDYLLDWMANAVQYPDQQANVAVVLKGERGGGKGSAIGYFAELFGQHHIHVFSSRQVTGNFNYHLRDAVVLFSDEAIYAGNRAEESVLKGLITERFIPIEGKHRDLVMVKNCLHVMISTNNQWAVPAGLDERRFFVLNMKDDEAVKQNTAYFNAIKKQMDDGGRGRLLGELLQRNIKDFNSFKAPNTVGLLEQKIESLDLVHAWWFNKLFEGKIFDAFDWEDLVPKEALYNDFVRSARDSGRSRFNPTPISFGMSLQRVLPAGWPKTHQAKVNDWFEKNKLLTSPAPKKNHYVFPSLAVCREAFEKAVGHPVVWQGHAFEGDPAHAAAARHAAKLEQL